MNRKTQANDHGTRSASSQGQNPSSVNQFFDALTEDYAGAIERCFPRYREMLWALLDYLPDKLRVERILELGSGTGNLSVLLHQRFPGATLDLVDVAAESLQHCRDRLGDDERCRFHAIDFRSMEFPENEFDLVISSIAIHHLTSPEKQALFRQLFSRLRPGGVLAYADQHAGATEAINARHQQHWYQASTHAGASEQEWQMWMRHQADHDHHDTLVEQIDWLREAGFQSVDCPWRYLLWTVLQAEKPAGIVRTDPNR